MNRKAMVGLTLIELQIDTTGKIGINYSSNEFIDIFIMIVLNRKNNRYFLLDKTHILYVATKYPCLCHYH